jgi:hypothetical protein
MDERDISLGWQTSVVLWIFAASLSVLTLVVNTLFMEYSKEMSKEWTLLKSSVCSCWPFSWISGCFDRDPLGGIINGEETPYLY